MKQLTQSVYIGSLRDALNIKLLDDAEIQAVLNLGDATPARSRLDSDRFLRVWVPLYDGAENPTEKYVVAVKTLDVLLSTYEKVLVHCMEGESRSAFVAAIYLDWNEEEEFDKVRYLHDFKNIHSLHIDQKDELLKQLRRIQ